MRILYVVNTYPDKKNPAAEPFVKAQIESIRKAGAVVEVFNVCGRESKLNYVKAIQKVRRIVRRSAFDVVHGHYMYSGWISALAGQRPSVVSFMGSDFLGTSNSLGNITVQGYFDIHLSKFLQFMVDGIIVKSPEMMGLLIKKDKAIVLPNGVNFDRFKKTSKTNAKQKLNLNIEKKYVLFAGNYLSPQKGYAIFTDAVNKLKKRFLEYEILLAHEVPHESVPIYMNAAEVLALPSLKEGSPNVVKEAIACDLPVVATDVGDIKQIIGDIPGCYLVDRSSDSFAVAIHKAVHSNIQFNGRAYINHLRIEDVAQRLLAFYKALIEARQ